MSYNSDKNNNHKNNPITIAVLSGDGIGAEVMNAALPVLQALGIRHELKFGEIGWECWRKYGDPVPQETWQLIKQTDACLLGAITSKPLEQAQKELPQHLQQQNITYVSPVIQLRQKLNLFANVRPIFNITSSRKFNFCIIRENTEGLYAGLDYATVPSSIQNLIHQHKNWRDANLDKASCTIRLQTEAGLARIFKFAFAYAKDHDYKKVTFADKPNVMRESSCFAKKIFDAVAKDYPEIEPTILNVDAVGLWIVRRPEDCGVIVAENMFGDILSDVAAGVMGGLGFAPSANIGAEYAYFEPVHGSAPKYAGKNIVNPSAMFLTIAMLLDRFGYIQDAIKIRSAIHKVVSDNKYVTYDLGGQASTSEMATAIIEYVTSDQRSQYIHKITPVTVNTYDSQTESQPITKSVAIIATGNELVKGEILDTNGQYFAQQLASHAIDVKSQQLVIDDQHLIEQELQRRLSEHDCVILCGGLGPTSDDKTRFAAATVIKTPLIFNQEQWDYICQRLTGFNLKVHESNRQQAMFPEGATILPNYNGTAAGCWLEIDNKLVVMLPGPPKECRPLFDQYIVPELLKRNFANNKQQLYWKLIGVIEADIAAIVDDIVQNIHNEENDTAENNNMISIETGYRINYPYLDVKISHNLENIQQISNLISTALASYKVTTIPNKTSIDLLRECLANHSDTRIYINDHLTQGVFATVMGHFDNIKYITDYHTGANNYQTAQEVSSGNVLHMTATGLASFHQHLPFSGVEYLCCTIDDSASQVVFNKKIEIPYRGKEVLDYAVHFMAYCLYQALTSDN